MLSTIALIFTFLAYTGAAKSSSYTYCYNYTECENDTITTSYAACYGYYGCDGADVESSYALAYGELGCYDASIDSKYTYAYGHYGAYAADIESYHLYAYGYESSRIADIEPYQTSLTIYFYGYYSGYGADVSCYSGDTCHIYCGSGYGCYGIDFYCYSGATCYYDCSGDDTCPTTYSGVDSDLTYVTSIGTSKINGDASDSEKSDLVNELAVVFSDLTDDEISEYKVGNQMAKDISKKKLEQDTKDDVESQLQMTFEQEYWEEGLYLEKDQNDMEAEKTYLYPEIEQFKKYKTNGKNNKNNNNNQLGVNRLKSLQLAGKGKGSSYINGNFVFGVSLAEYGAAFVVDIFIIAVALQAYSYCMKAKIYQAF